MNFASVFQNPLSVFVKMCVCVFFFFFFFFFFWGGGGGGFDI